MDNQASVFLNEKASFLKSGYDFPKINNDAI